MTCGCPGGRARLLARRDRSAGHDEGRRSLRSVDASPDPAAYYAGSMRSRDPGNASVEICGHGPEALGGSTSRFEPRRSGQSRSWKSCQQGHVVVGAPKFETRPGWALYSSSRLAVAEAAAIRRPRSANPQALAIRGSGSEPPGAPAEVAWNAGCRPRRRSARRGRRSRRSCGAARVWSPSGRGWTMVRPSSGRRRDELQRGIIPIVRPSSGPPRGLDISLRKMKKAPLIIVAERSMTAGRSRRSIEQLCAGRALVSANGSPAQQPEQMVSSGSRRGSRNSGSFMTVR